MWKQGRCTQSVMILKLNINWGAEFFNPWPLTNDWIDVDINIISNQTRARIFQNSVNYTGIVPRMLNQKAVLSSNQNLNGKSLFVWQEHDVTMELFNLSCQSKCSDNLKYVLMCYVKWFPENKVLSAAKQLIKQICPLQIIRN